MSAKSEKEHAGDVFCSFSFLLLLFQNVSAVIEYKVSPHVLFSGLAHIYARITNLTFAMLIYSLEVIAGKIKLSSFIIISSSVKIIRFVRHEKTFRTKASLVR